MVDLWFYNLFILIIPSLVPKGMNGIFYYFLMFSAPMLLIGLFLFYLKEKNIIPGSNELSRQVLTFDKPKGRWIKNG